MVLFRTSSFAKIVTFFAVQLRMLISFLNDVELHFVLEFKNSLGKYHPVFKRCFLGTPCCINQGINGFHGI